jgi:alkylresorcinol/alkylpyrone synthase
MKWYCEPRGWLERIQAFLEGAKALFADVVRKAIERAGWDALAA